MAINPAEIDRRSGVNRPKKKTPQTQNTGAYRNGHSQARERNQQSQRARTVAGNAERNVANGIVRNPYAADVPALQPMTNGGGGRGRGYGGGGGGAGNGEMKAAAKSQIDLLMQMLRSDGMRSPTREFTPDTQSREALAGAYAADQSRQGQSFDQLDQYLGGLGNAYADGPQAQAAQVDPSNLQALLQSQGASGQGLGAEAQFLQSQNDNMAGAQDRYQQAMQNMQSSWNQSAQSESRQARAYAGEELSAQNRGLSALIDRNDASRRQGVEDQNFQRSLSDRKSMMELIAQISQISAGAGIKSPEMDIDKLIAMLSGGK